MYLFAILNSKSQYYSDCPRVTELILGQTVKGAWHYGAKIWRRPKVEFQNSISTLIVVFKSIFCALDMLICAKPFAQNVKQWLFSVR